MHEPGGQRALVPNRVALEIGAARLHQHLIEPGDIASIIALRNHESGANEAKAIVSIANVKKRVRRWNRQVPHDLYMWLLLVPWKLRNKRHRFDRRTERTLPPLHGGVTLYAQR